MNPLRACLPCSYGPDLYPVLTLGIRLNVLAGAWQENMGEVAPRAQEVRWGTVSSQPCSS